MSAHQLPIGNTYVTIANARSNHRSRIPGRSRTFALRPLVDKLDAVAASKVSTALYRMEQGNFSNVEGVGEGVCECKIDFGPGYRIYFGRDGEALVILLGGSSKQRQQAAIDAAKHAWRAYKQGKIGKKGTR